MLGPGLCKISCKFCLSRREYNILFHPFYYSLPNIVYRRSIIDNKIILPHIHSFLFVYFLQLINNEMRFFQGQPPDLLLSNG